MAGHSLNGELYYRFRPVSWLELQPGLQYWHRPGGVAQTQDAWVVEWKNRRDLLIVAILITFFHLSG
ncbi:putative carbohydrate-selective porin [Klebsiella pneumoniae]|uniref:Putative carbohydrate-selective porin n=1 Tax=Klebsiella pneumoniae TaxID=573 RepID=A0A2X3ISZ6_KLEPN|nr:putative carbohydrate-selective porin [Klebsiella pneumoniae]